MVVVVWLSVPAYRVMCLVVPYALPYSKCKNRKRRDVVVTNHDDIADLPIGSVMIIHSWNDREI